MFGYMESSKKWVKSIESGRDNRDEGEGKGSGNSGKFDRFCNALLKDN